MAQKRVITEETKDKIAPLAKAKSNLKALIAIHDADKSKVKIEDILNRLHQIEILIDARLGGGEMT